jgi:hypothetical protein
VNVHIVVLVDVLDDYISFPFYTNFLRKDIEEGEP